MIDVTVSLQTKLEKSPFYFAVLHWVDPIIKKDQYKWKTTKVKYIDEKQKRLHKQAEQDANNKAEQIRKAFEDEFGMNVQIPVHKEEAAYGASLFAMTAAGICGSLEEAQQLISYNA